MRATVDAIQFHQFGSETKNDLITLFSATAKDLAGWAGIPRKGWRIRMLFQRWITDGREKELKEFWDSASKPNPESGRFLMGPTAIIVAIHDDADFSDGKLTLNYSSPITGVASDTEKLRILASNVLPRIRKRMENDKESINLLDTFSDNALLDTLPEVNHNYVLEFALQLCQMQEDPEWFINTNRIDASEIPGLITSMEALCRPAVVVDGQHRLWGAASINSDVRLPVVALSNCEWTDQIYQFVVINDKAQKVKGDLLNDIFASSLTPTEQGEMRKDFGRVKVDIEKRIAGVLAGQDPDSPFYQMVTLDLPTPPVEMKNAYISQTIIQNLIDGGRGALGWRSDHSFFDNYVKPTFPDRETWERWQDGKWKEYWFAFWKTVVSEYTPQAKRAHNKDASFEIWSKIEQSNLTKGVGLKLFQRFFMETMSELVKEEKKVQAAVLERLNERLGEAEAAKQSQDDLRKVAIPDTVDEFTDVVRKFLERFPVTFFTASWLPSLDDSDGQERLLSAMREAYTSDNFRARGRGVFES
jgi:hypothetical protein